MRPDELVAARLEVFRRWPSSSTAAALYQDSGTTWPTYQDEVMQQLARSPHDAVVFAQYHLKDVRLAWELAHVLALGSDRAWSDLVKAYEKVDPSAVLPVLNRLAAGSEHDAEVDWFIAELRETNRRRPRLQQEFDRAGLP